MSESKIIAIGQYYPGQQFDMFSCKYYIEKIPSKENYPFNYALCANSNVICKFITLGSAVKCMKEKMRGDNFPFAAIQQAIEQTQSL